MKAEKSLSFFIVLSTISLLLNSTAVADVSLPSIISDNMVLQQQAYVPIWGYADPAEKITIESSWHVDEKYTTVADTDGNWLIKIHTPKASGPYALIIKGQNQLTIKNIAIGEVWLASGQSNMQMPMEGFDHQQQVIDSEMEINAATYENIRLFNVQRIASPEPLNDCNGQWQQCTPETVKSFSAVGYFFGKKLHNELNIPIGLIQSAWNGTPAESWTRKEVMQDDPDLGKIITSAREQFDLWTKKVADANANGQKLVMPLHLSYKSCWPTYLYNGMISPIIPYRIKGAIWYQGESNASRAYQYRKLFPAMINSWRKDWGFGDFPFYYAQLTSYLRHAPDEDVIVEKGQPKDELWAELREAQLMTLDLPNTGMAVTIDIGQANNIHPPNKRDVGYRLAFWALAKDYSRDIVYSGVV